MDAWTYLRVSTDEQVEGTSLETQDAACRAWCAREGFTLPAAGIYREEGESAKTSQRPALIRLLAEIRRAKPRPACLVVYKLDRLARNQADHHSIRALLAGLGVRLASATEALTDDPAGRLLEGMLAAVAQFDNEVRSERCRAGMAAAAGRGAWVWRAPLGYVTTRAADGSASLAPDPVRAPALLAGFEAVASGDSSAEALRKAAALGLTTRTGAPLAQQHWSGILRNPAYCAVLSSALLDGDLADGNWPPIVQRDVWARVQAALGSDPRAVARVRERPDFPLRGFARCGECGSLLTASWSKGRSKRYGYYHCYRCRRVRRRREDLEGDFIALLERSRLAPGLLELVRREVLAVLADEWRGAAALAAAARKRVEEAERRRERLVDLIVSGSLDPAAGERRLARLRAELVEAKLAAEAPEDADLDLEAAWAAAARLYGDPAGVWRMSDLEGRRALQALLFPQGVTWSRTAGLRTAATCVLLGITARSRRREKMVGLRVQVGTGNTLAQWPAWAREVIRVGALCA